MKSPKISIITINFNNRMGLKKTIKSIVSQVYRNFEHIIIDGNSTDGSKKIIEKYKNLFSYWVSEPDKGIYNAMNKGIKEANGEYLLFLNSGDVLVDNYILGEVKDELRTDIDIYYGNLIFDDEKGNWTYVYPEKLSFHYFLNKTLPHPATFIKKKLFNSVFYYNEKFKIVSDWEFFICAIFKYNVSYKHINKEISIFDVNGISGNDNNRKIIIEERKIVLEKYFPNFLDDYNKLDFYLTLNRFKALLELEKNTTAQKLNSLWLHILLFLFRNKKVDDL